MALGRPYGAKPRPYMLPSTRTAVTLGGRRSLQGRPFRFESEHCNRSTLEEEPMRHRACLEGSASRQARGSSPPASANPPRRDARVRPSKTAAPAPWKVNGSGTRPASKAVDESSSEVRLLLLPPQDSVACSPWKSHWGWSPDPAATRAYLRVRSSTLPTSAAINDRARPRRAGGSHEPAGLVRFQALGPCVETGWSPCAV